MRYPTNRKCLRLPKQLLSAIDERAVTVGHETTRTSIIKECLSQLVHDLQFERMQNTTIEKLLTTYGERCERQQITLRLPIVITDYLQINNINLTAAVEVALKHYCSWLPKE